MLIYRNLLFLLLCLVLVKGRRIWNRYKAIVKDMLGGLEDEQKKVLAVSKHIRKFSLLSIIGKTKNLATNSKSLINRR